jgi:hypothetical protein
VGSPHLQTLDIAWNFLETHHTCFYSRPLRSFQASSALPKAVSVPYSATEWDGRRRVRVKPRVIRLRFELEAPKCDFWVRVCY